MTAQTVNFWQSVKQAFVSNPPSQLNIRRVTIRETEAYTLPRNTHQVRVLTGGAWVSVAGEDMILTKGETLTLRADRSGVIVTAVSRKPLQLELQT